MNEFLNFWISTIVLSAGFNLSNNIQTIKDIYDLGYKINVDNIDKYESTDISAPNDLDNTVDYNRLSMLIPIINILEATRERLEYNENREDMLYKLDMAGVLEEMTPLEKEIYFKHPNILSALFLETLTSLRINKANVIEVRTNDEYGDIYYEYGKDISEIKILKATDDMAKISETAQIEKVKSTIYGFIEQCVDNFMQGIEYTADDESKEQMKKEFIEYAFALLNEKTNKKAKKRTRKK